ncbi:MAG: hypothetical protein ACKOYP_03435, partial [Bacteroidota bacterium]
MRSPSFRYRPVLQEASNPTRERQANCLNFLLIFSTMTGKSTFKLIKSLQLKKYRLAEQCFMVQGWKGVEMLLTSRYEVVLVAATAPFIPRVEVM